VDVLAHGLWGGAGFVPLGRNKFTAALLLGMAPDLLSFGLFHLTHPQWIGARILGTVSGPPPLEILPEVVFHAYNLTHSLVLWCLMFAVVWAWKRSCPWVLLAWGLHILCDIPTHNLAYFPTPYLWPFPTPYVRGISWATGWFMATNYSALLVVYTGVLWYRTRLARSAVL